MTGETITITLMGNSEKVIDDINQISLALRILKMKALKAIRADKLLILGLMILALFCFASVFVWSIIDNRPGYMVFTWFLILYFGGRMHLRVKHFKDLKQQIQSCTITYKNYTIK